MLNCLTATELDKLIQPRLSAHYISAYRLYGVRTGEAGPDGPTKLAALIRERVNAHGWAIAPFHVAHHWATAFFYLRRGALHTRVYDSAPSPRTQFAFVKVIQSLGFDEPEVVSHGKQPRGSNECGVHVVWLAAMQENKSPTPYLPRIQPPGHEMVIPLGALRRVLAAALPNGLANATAKRLLDLVPAPERHEEPPLADPAGGAAPKSDPPVRVRNPDNACYIIATLQALAHTIPAGRLTGPLEARLQELRGRSAGPIALDDDIRATMQNPAKPVPVGKIGQHDAEEFLTRLLSTHETLAAQFATCETTTTKRRSEPDSQQQGPAVGVRLPVGPLTDTIEDAFDVLEDLQVIDRTVSTMVQVKPAADNIFFQLKRFGNDGEKIAKSVSVPQQFDRDDYRYEVTAAVLHKGSTPKVGHYTACVKRGGEWWLVDDAKDPQRVADPRQYLNRAYLVFAHVTALPGKKQKKQDQAVAADHPPQIAAEPTNTKQEPAPTVRPSEDDKRREHDRKVGNFMHTTTVDAYVEKLRAAGAPAVLYNTADSELAKLIHAANEDDAHAVRRLAILQRRHDATRDASWVVCADKHFVAAVRRAGRETVELYDSMPAKRPELKRTVHAIGAIMARLDGKTGAYKIEHLPTPRQRPDSNDCARHALRAVLARGAIKDTRLPTRDEIVDLVTATPPNVTEAGPAAKSTVEQPKAERPAAEHGTLVQFAYTILPPGDRRRQQMRKGAKSDNQLPMLVLRVDVDEGDTVKCPLCEDGSAHQFTKIGNYGAARAIEYHIKTRHGMCLRTLRLAPCPCGTEAGGAKCGAMALKVTVNQNHGVRAHVPHQDATLCGTCNAWWGNRSPAMPFRSHPCIPPGDGRKAPPWPLNHIPQRDEGPVGVETLTPSPPRTDEPNQATAPDFRTGEWRSRLPPLAETPVQSLTILADADPDLAKAMVRKALAKETRMSHVRMLRAVGEAAQKLVTTEDPLAKTHAIPWLIDWIKQRASESRWRWATINAHMGVLQSAMNYVQTYVKGVSGAWHLWTDTNWKLAMRTARTKAAADRPTQALPATPEQVLRACKLASPDVAFVLAVTWITFGRSGALIQLRREDVELRDETNGDTTFTITIMRGKSNRLGQDPHTVTGKLGDFSIYVKPIVNAITNPRQFIIHAPSSRHRDNIRNAMKSALRSANNEPRLENRSLRRGSLQMMATAGATTQMLLACSGHSSVKSLKRYLNFGRVMTDEQKAVTKIYDSIVKGGSGNTVLSC